MINRKNRASPNPGDHLFDLRQRVAALERQSTVLQRPVIRANPVDTNMFHTTTSLSFVTAYSISFPLGVPTGQLYLSVRQVADASTTGRCRLKWATSGETTSNIDSVGVADSFIVFKWRFTTTGADVLNIQHRIMSGGAGATKLYVPEFASFASLIDGATTTGV